MSPVRAILFSLAALLAGVGVVTVVNKCLKVPLTKLPEKLGCLRRQLTCIAHAQCFVVAQNTAIEFFGQIVQFTHFELQLRKPNLSNRSAAQPHHGLDKVITA